MIIRRAKRRDVEPPKDIRLDQTGATPRKGRAAKSDSKEIRRQPGVTSVSVGEGVNPRELVMKPKRDRVWFETLVVYPVAGCVDEVAELGLNQPVIDADPPVLF